MWDNPNYWIRFALVRSALGLSAGHELGILGQYRAGVCARTLQRFRISEAIQIRALRGERQQHRQEVRRLLARTETPDDILHWTLPHGLPPDFVYDGLLRRQRAACVDLDHPRLLDDVAEALGCLTDAERLLDAYPCDLLLLSHVIGFQHAALAWLAIERHVPTLLLFGNYGVLRCVKLHQPNDLYDWTDRPGSADIAALSPGQAELFARAGRAYLEKRRAGQTNDLGAQLAFQRPTTSIDRATLVQQFHWDPRVPIIGIYASTWFDYPHASGMRHFRDFLDWLHANIRVVSQLPHVNWLFKAHPCDEYYGGVTLRDLMPSVPQRHVQLAPAQWSGAALLESLDGMVTYGGTVGVEGAACGKPVLLADRGWYHDVGFAKWTKSREEYLQTLATPWWTSLDLVKTTRLAQIFAGWYFCRPAWQGGFVLGDDSVQDPLYEDVPRLFAENQDAIAREVETIRQWFGSESRRYHTDKMRHAELLVC